MGTHQVETPQVETLDVLFRDEGEPKGSPSIVAIFPSLLGTYEPHTFTVYSHVGQHGTGSRAWLADTRPASKRDSASLLAELRQIYEGDPAEPCKLRVVSKVTAAHHNAREAEARRLRAR